MFVGDTVSVPFAHAPEPARARPSRGGSCWLMQCAHLRGQALNRYVSLQSRRKEMMAAVDGAPLNMNYRSGLPCAVSPVPYCCAITRANSLSRTFHAHGSRVHRILKSQVDRKKNLTLIYYYYLHILQPYGKGYCRSGHTQ